MRFMRWSYVDLLACPVDYVPIIIREANQNEGS